MSNQSVLEVIAGRLLARQNGVSHHDTARLCLAVEGGGMRGVVSYGMLMALRDLQMLDMFDSYVGVSAGSFNLAYNLAGQSAEGLSFYLDDMGGSELSNLLRFQFEGRPFVDMRRLHDYVARKRPLAVDKLRVGYGATFRIGATNVSQNNGELLNLDHTGGDFESLLFASSILPFIDGEPWQVGSSKYYDGGLYYIDPALAAQELQATHTLILYSRPQDHPVQSYSSNIEQRVNRLNKQFPESGNHYMAALQAYVSIYSSLAFGEVEVQDMRAYRHALPQSLGVERQTTDQHVLLQGVKSGYQSILDLFYRRGQTGVMPVLLQPSGKTV